MVLGHRLCLESSLYHALMAPEFDFHKSFVGNRLGFESRYEMVCYSAAIIPAASTVPCFSRTCLMLVNSTDAACVCVIWIFPFLLFPWLFQHRNSLVFYYFLYIISHTAFIRKGFLTDHRLIFKFKERISMFLIGSFSILHFCIFPHIRYQAARFVPENMEEFITTLLFRLVMIWFLIVR